ncbi:hypothetical protein OAS86_00460 [Gammaproteobacteria bacterium]|nr:hypothetical protein [Gammaproteobacteria bacterium]
MTLIAGSARLAAMASIAQRVAEVNQQIEESDTILTGMPLIPLTGCQPGLSVTLREYLQLIDAAARQRISGKRGYLPANCTDILQRINGDPGKWLGESSSMGHGQRRFVGHRSLLKAVVEQLGQRWVKGTTMA